MKNLLLILLLSLSGCAAVSYEYSTPPLLNPPHNANKAVKDVNGGIFFIYHDSVDCKKETCV